MTTMTEEAASPERTIHRRPASGITIDGHRLEAWRERRGWSRADLSREVAALAWTDDNGDLVTYSRDALAKAENNDRRPKPITLRALCAVLSTPDEPCTPADLRKGGRPMPLPPSVRAAAQRRARNTAMRAWADARGISYRDPRTGRVYYTKSLRDAYDAWCAENPRDAAGSEDGDEAAEDEPVLLAS